MATQHHTRSPFIAWFIWFVAVINVVFQFFLQLSSGTMVNQLMQAFSITAFGAGLLSSSFFYIYVALQTPAGMLVDRFGPRHLLTLGGLISTCGIFLFAQSHNLIVAEIGRLLMGAGSSFAFVSALYLIGQWFNKERFGFMFGLAETIAMFGTFFGTIFLAQIMQTLNWRDSMLIAASIAFVLSIISWLAIRDKPAHNLLTAPVGFSAFLKEVKLVVTSRALWINGLYAGLLFSIVTVFAALWGVPFLIQLDQVSTMTATLISSTVFIGIAIGSPIMGWIYPRLKSVNSFLFGAAVAAMLVASWILYFPPRSLVVLDLAMFLLGLICSSYVFNFTLGHELAPETAKSTGVGFTNTLCMLMAPLLQPVVGWILDLTNQSTNGSYSLSSYHWALMVLPLALLGAAVLARFIPKIEAAV